MNVKHEDDKVAQTA